MALTARNIFLERNAAPKIITEWCMGCSPVINWKDGICSITFVTSARMRWILKNFLGIAIFAMKVITIYV